MSDVHAITLPAQPAPAPPATSLHEPRLTESQAHSAADSLLASAKALAELTGEPFDQAATEAQITAALARDGHDVEFGFDDRTDIEKAFDRHNAPAADAGDYRPHLSPGRPLLDGVSPEHVEAVRTELMGAALAMELPADVGTAWLDACLSSAEKTGTFRTPEARAQYKAENVAALQHIAGSEQAYAELIAAAQTALSRAPAATVTALRDIGALDSAETILTLAHHQQRLNARAHT